MKNKTLILGLINTFLFVILGALVFFYSDIIGDIYAENKVFTPSGLKMVSFIIFNIAGIDAVLSIKANKNKWAGVGLILLGVMFIGTIILGIFNLIAGIYSIKYGDYMTKEEKARYKEELRQDRQYRKEERAEDREYRKEERRQQKQYYKDACKEEAGALKMHKLSVILVNIIVILPISLFQCWPLWAELYLNGYSDIFVIIEENVFMYILFYLISCIVILLIKRGSIFSNNYITTTTTHIEYDVDTDILDNVYVNEKNRTTTQEDTPIVAFISIFYILTAGISLFLLLIGNLYIILTPYYRKRCYPIIRYCTFRDECFEYMAFNSDMLGIILALYFSFIPVRQEFLENYHRIV